MSGWSQEASDNLGKIASDAVEMAQRTPGGWVNPLEPHLKSRVRYARTSEEIQQFLAEMRADPQEIADFVSTCSHGFFQAYLSKPDFLTGDQHADQAAFSLERGWYDELHSRDDGDHYEEIIRLIKRMGGIETEKIQSIKLRRCLTGPSPISDFKQFISADRRFPISVSYPARLSFFYDFNREEFLHIDWYDGDALVLGISRQNLARSAQRGDRDIQLLLRGKKDASQFMQEDFARRHADAVWLGRDPAWRTWCIEERVVGEKERPINAKRLVWSTPSGAYGGEWVFFLRYQRGGIWSCSAIKELDQSSLLPEFWTIYNHSLVDGDTFNMFLSSFQWLSEEFFRSLPAQP